MNNQYYLHEDQRWSANFHPEWSWYIAMFDGQHTWVCANMTKGMGQYEIDFANRMTQAGAMVFFPGEFKPVKQKIKPPYIARICGDFIPVLTIKDENYWKWCGWIE